MVELSDGTIRVELAPILGIKVPVVILVLSYS